MTEILLRNAPKELEEDIWKLCKKLAGFAHAPVSLAEYKRVREYAENSEIVNVILSGLRRNMKVLKKEYKDLEVLEQKLSGL